MSAILFEQEVIHYEVLGRGKPVIFLHSWVGSWRYWIPTMQAASVSCRTYALDMWGFGDTARAPGRYDIDRQAALVGAFMQQMGIGRAALVGHGLGAVVALRLALLLPETVDRVLAVAYPLDVDAVSPRILSGTPLELADWLTGKSSQGSSPVRMEAPKTDPMAVQGSYPSLGRSALRQTVSGLPCPCLLVHGADDPLVRPIVLDDLLLMPEQIHGLLFEESAHFPMLEESSKFNRLLADFLALEPGESPRKLQLKEEWKRRVR